MNITEVLDKEYQKYEENYGSATSQRVSDMYDRLSEMVAHHVNHSRVTSASLQALHEQQQANHAQMIDTLARPKTIIRGPDGKIVGVK